MKIYIGNEFKPVTLISAGLDAKDKLCYLRDTCDKLLGKIDWTQSFNQHIYIIHDEVVNADLLIGLDAWLRHRACDISNISLVTTHDLGVSDWWQSYNNLMGQKSFRIQEELFFDSRRFRPLYFDTPQPLPDKTWLTENRVIEKYFSYYGGWYALSDRNIMTLMLSPWRDHGIMGSVGDFESRQTLLNFSEYVTGYMRQDFVERMADYYDRFVDAQCRYHAGTTLSGALPQQNEPFDFCGYQWQVDRRCFATIVRETHNDRLWPSVTEKTYRAFYHYTAAVPVGFKAVQQLESLGFWFPHDLIDYSYQHEKNFVYRMESMMTGFRDFMSAHTTADLNQYFVDNFDNFHHNAEMTYILATKNRAEYLYKDTT